MNDIVCCPLQGNDGEGPTCSSRAVRKARKEHTCSECREPIPKGTTYDYSSGIWDGRADSFKTCLLCVEIRDHFACEGWVYETLWSDLTENFFPDMKCGGQCMTGLSPDAKRKLIDARMEWYFAQDEISDDAWEDWPKNKDVQRPLREVPVVEPKDDYYSLPEVYWPERLKQEALMREYEEQEAKEKDGKT
jgi:hypothetical protein